MRGKRLGGSRRLGRRRTDVLLGGSRRLGRRRTDVLLSGSRRLGRRRTVPLAMAAVAVVAGADWVIHYRSPRWILIALYDHPAHLATAGLVALNLPSRSPRWHAGFMAGSLLPDVDHVPLALAEEHPTPGTRRPATHCLLAIAPLFALARASRSELVEGVAWGTVAHFARDVSIPPGAPLLRPIHNGDLLIPYAIYAAALAAFAGRAAASAMLFDGL